MPGNNDELKRQELQRNAGASSSYAQIYKKTGMTPKQANELSNNNIYSDAPYQLGADTNTGINKPPADDDRYPKSAGFTNQSGKIGLIYGDAYTGGDPNTTTKNDLIGAGPTGVRSDATPDGNSLDTPVRMRTDGGDVIGPLEYNKNVRNLQMHPMYQSVERQRQAELEEQQRKDAYGVQSTNPEPTPEDPGYSYQQYHHPRYR